MEIHDESLYSQQTDLQLINILVPFLANKSFIDIGGEKGTFGEFLMNLGLHGQIFEPLPHHHERLKNLVSKTNSQFFEYAIDEIDRKSDFYISCQEDGSVNDYFHSLEPLQNDERVRHQKQITVQCRSLESLYQEGILPKDIGVIKIDTEGCDLRVLRGLGSVRAEIIVCEFITPGLYNGWEQARPEGLIEEAEKQGLSDYIAIKRKNDCELVSLKPAIFQESQWGNIIFLNKSLYQKAFPSIKNFIANHEANLCSVLEYQKLQTVCQERLDLINYLHKEAAERLSIINKLKAKVKGFF